VLLQQLRRVRWAVRATLILGVAASVVANVLHALDNPISQSIAAWPPLALLLTVELISRVPVHRRLLAAARLFATATIAGIAAWVSYWHMAGVASRYGETGASPYLLPLSVDGLIVVASICLVELGGRISTLERPEQPAEAPAEVPATPGPIPAVIPAPAQPAHAPAMLPEPVPAARATAESPLRRSTAAALAEAAAALPRVPADRPAPAQRNAPSQRNAPAQRGVPAQRAVPAQHGVPAQRAVPAQRNAPAQRTTTTARAAVAPRAESTTKAGAPSTGNDRTGGAGSQTRTRNDETAARARRTPAETVALANEIKARRPSMTENEIAAELGISPSRWRTVRREAATQSGDHTLAA
jgi:hypothetical protein